MPKTDKQKGLFQRFKQSTMGDFFSKPGKKSSSKATVDSTDSKRNSLKGASSKKKVVLPSEKRRSMWAARDTEEYRNRYPGKKDYPNKKDNLLFYTNQLESKPDGGLIDWIHEEWFGDYEKLERHHGYIQWLFPIRESGLNWKSQELQLHEIESILKDADAKKRILTSYKMMLDFYGMKLKDEETGEIERAENWRARFKHLNSSFHNYLRITRILKCLGEFEYEYLKAPFVKFVLKEGMVHETLDNVMESCERYWIGVIRDKHVQDEVFNYYDDLYCQVNSIEVKQVATKTKKETDDKKPKENKTASNDYSDMDTVEYAMTLMDDPADSGDEGANSEGVTKGANPDRKVHSLSESEDDGDESQEAKYWKEDENNSAVGSPGTLDVTPDTETADTLDSEMPDQVGEGLSVNVSDVTGGNAENVSKTGVDNTKTEDVNVKFQDNSEVCSDEIVDEVTENVEEDKDGQTVKDTEMELSGKSQKPDEKDADNNMEVSQDTPEGAKAVVTNSKDSIINEDRRNVKLEGTEVVEIETDNSITNGITLESTGGEQPTGELGNVDIKETVPEKVEAGQKEGEENNQKEAKGDIGQKDVKEENGQREEIGENKESEGMNEGSQIEEKMDTN